MSPSIRDLPEAARFERLSKWLVVHKGMGISMMDHLYNKLDGLYPGTWAGKFKNEASLQNWRETWAEQFENDGITPGHIKGGLVECGRRYSYPPNAKEFIDACKAAIPPAMHREFPHSRRIEHKLTEEERAANQARARALIDQFFRSKQL